MAIADLARRFNLGADLLMSTVGGQLGSVIGGRLEAGLLYTSAYLSRIKAQVPSPNFCPNSYIAFPSYGIMQSRQLHTITAVQLTASMGQI